MQLESYCITNEENKIVFNTKGKFITYGYLKRRVKDIEEQIANKDISSLETQMLVLFSYALDFINASESELVESLRHIKIDIVNAAIGKTYIFEKENCLNELDLKKVLLKKIGAYEMLVHYNFYLEWLKERNIVEPKVEIISKNKVSLDVTDLILRVDGEIIDIFDSVKYSIENEFVIGGEIPPEILKKMGISIEEIKQKCDVLAKEAGEDISGEDEIEDPFIAIMDGFCKKMHNFSQKLLNKWNVPNKEIGRNDPCPCGSGKKYKKCCGK